MAVDIVNEFIRMQDGYRRLRGGRPSTGVKHPRSGQPLVLPNTEFPRTTWADVFVVKQHLQKYSEPNQLQCAELWSKHKGWDHARATSFCLWAKPFNFVKTAKYKDARSRFASATPLPKAGWITVLSKLGRNEEYPYNEEFWGYAKRYAIARDAAGEVPFWADIALDSIKEAIVEAPETIKDALSAAVSAVDPRNLIPPVPTDWIALFKWGSVAGALGMFYWYVLRPKKR